MSIKVLASLTSESGIFFFTFRKRWVGRAMGNETFYRDGLIVQKQSILFIELKNIRQNFETDLR